MGRGGGGGGLSIMTEPGIGPSIDQEKTLCGTADPDHCVEAGVERGGHNRLSKLACRESFCHSSLMCHTERVGIRRDHY